LKRDIEDIQQLLQPVSAIVTVCAIALRAAQTAPMDASQVKQMLGGRLRRMILGENNVQ